MNYNRYLDLHLCTTTNISGEKADQQALVDSGDQSQAQMDKMFFSSNGTTFFYEFRGDMASQARYRSGKSEGFTFDPDAWFAKGNSRSFEDVEITTADISLLRLRNGEISDELRQLRYIGCMVAIEQLKTTDIHPNLQALVRWIADATTTNKLRINCHGAGTATHGFKMGSVELSVDELVQALVRHGLRRQGTVWNDGTVVSEKYQQTLSGLAHNARWKLDSEVSQCEKCTHTFEKTWYGSTTKHHCRRCGGIFCDNCTGKRTDLRIALTGPNNATTKNVRNARVCDKCFSEARDSEGIRDAAGHELKYGLQQIALGLCMGARVDDQFSPQREDPAAGTLVAGSLACRLVEVLQRENLRGIRVSASNAIVANVAGVGLRNQFGVSYPHTIARSRGRRKQAVVRQTLEGSGSFTFPAYIWGTQDTLRNMYNGLPNPKPDPTIVVEGGAIHFGRVPIQATPSAAAAAQGAGQAVAPRPATPDPMRVLQFFYSKWSFTSWHPHIGHEYRQARTVGANDSRTIKLVAPPRVTRLENDPTAPPSAQPPHPDSFITLTGRQVDIFKQTKSYGTS